MPYTREELENYQWYQDRLQARKDSYDAYLEEVQQDQIDNETRNHIVDDNGTLLSFENINDDVRLQEPFRRAGLDREDHYIVHSNLYPVYTKGQRFELTIDTNIRELSNTPSSLPNVRLFNPPQENLIKSIVYTKPDTDGTLLSPLLLTPSREIPNVRTDGYTITLTNGDIIAPSGWNEITIDTSEDKIDNYLEVYYLENNVRRQFPNQKVLNSYIGILLSTFVEQEIIVIEKEDLNLIPYGSPMDYNVG